MDQKRMTDLNEACRILLEIGNLKRDLDNEIIREQYGNAEVVIENIEKRLAILRAAIKP